MTFQGELSYQNSEFFADQVGDSNFFHKCMIFEKISTFMELTYKVVLLKLSKGWTSLQIKEGAWKETKTGSKLKKLPIEKKNKLYKVN